MPAFCSSSITHNLMTNVHYSHTLKSKLLHPGPNLCRAFGFVIWPIPVRPPQFCGLDNLYTSSVAGLSGQTGNLYPRAKSHRINAAGCAWETPTSPRVARLFNTPRLRNIWIDLRKKFRSAVVYFSGLSPQRTAKFLVGLLHPKHG